MIESSIIRFLDIGQEGEKCDGFGAHANNARGESEIYPWRMVGWVGDRVGLQISHLLQQFI